MTAENSDLRRATFGYHERIHLRKDFQHILKCGRRLVHPALFIYTLRRADDSKTSRLGLITSRKVGGAVQRNRLKRRLREIFRLHKHDIAPGTDTLFVLRSAGVALPYEKLEAAVLELWKRAGVLAA